MATYQPNEKQAQPVPVNEQDPYKTDFDDTVKTNEIPPAEQKTFAITDWASF